MVYGRRALNWFNGQNILTALANILRIWKSSVNWRFLCSRAQMRQTSQSNTRRKMANMTLHLCTVLSICFKYLLTGYQMMTDHTRKTKFLNRLHVTKCCLAGKHEVIFCDIYIKFWSLQLFCRNAWNFGHLWGETGLILSCSKQTKSRQNGKQR